MSEVSTWNAVDASNNATPPDGFPEGMQPSAVNDAARMMMGALRREHDLITAKIGSVAGAISTTTINSTTINASGTITGTTVNSTGNASVTGVLTAGSVSVNGNVNLNGYGTLYANGAQFLRADAFGTGYNQIFDNQGNISIRLGWSGDASNQYRQGGHYFQSNAGAANYCYFTALGTYNISGSWIVISDRETKEDIGEYRQGLEAVRALRPVTFRYRKGTPFEGEARHIGLIADEVEPHLPELVGEDGKYRTLQPGNLVYALINACQELAERVARLEKEKSDV